MIGEIAEAIRGQGAAAENSAQAAQDLDRLAADMRQIVSTYRL